MFHAFKDKRLIIDRILEKACKQSAVSACEVKWFSVSMFFYECLDRRDYTIAYLPFGCSTQH